MKIAPKRLMVFALTIILLVNIFNAPADSNNGRQDWIYCEDVTGEIGVTITSGLGKEYRVTSIENNYDSGRIRIILDDEDGSQMMLCNLPAFRVEPKTGQMYYIISEYCTDEKYM